jgi:hypothetical protein
MKKNIKIPAWLQQTRQQFSGHQKSFALYFVILVVCLLMFPVIKINYLDSTQVDTFKLFHGYMWKTASIISLTLVFLATYNFSTQARHFLNRILGMKSSTYLVNVWGLLIILISLFSVGDTITLLKQTFSSRVWTAPGFLILWVIIILWIVRNLMLARIEHKKTGTSKEVTIHQQKDASWIEPGFEKAQKEMEGLFGWE